MSRRCRNVGHALLIMGAAGLGPSVAAQWLDLDAPAPPTLREGSVFEDLAAQLGDEADAFERAASIESGATRLAAQAKAGFRRLGAALLRAGAARQGVGGDAPISGGQRIARTMPALDALADASTESATPAGVRAAITVRLRAFLEAAARFDASSVPDGPTLDVSLAALFGELAEVEGMLTGRTGPSAWPLDPRSPATPAVDALRSAIASSGWSDATIEALRPLVEALEAAESDLTIAPAAGDAITLLDRTSRAAGSLTGGAWLSEAETAALRARLEDGVRRFSDPATRRDARSRLEGATVLAETLAQAQAAASAGGDEGALRDLTTAAAARLSGDALSDDDRRVVGAFRAFLDRVTWSRPRLRRDGWSRDQTKPAWGALVPLVRTAEEAAAKELGAALRDPTAMQRPGVISAIAHHREVVEALRRLERVNGLLAALAARGDEGSKLAAEGVLRLVGALEDESQQAWAMRQLARFEEQWRTLGEPLALTSDDPQAVRDQAQALQSAWLSAWADGEPGDEAERLAPLARLLSLRADAALVAGAPSDAPTFVWAGLAGSGDAIRAEAERCLVAVNESIRSGGKRLEDPQRWATVSAVAAIERTLSQMWTQAPTAPGAAGLAIPPSAQAWLITERDHLASIARWALELEGAERRGESGRAEDIRAFLAPAGLRLLDAVEESGAPAMLAP